MLSPEIELVPTKKAAHPKVSEMVNQAITTLAERKGSSLHAINKCIHATYGVDVKKLAVYIKKYLKTAVESGEIIQPTGKGANGSFKLSKQQKAEIKSKVSEAKPTKMLTMKTSTPKKSRIPKSAFDLYKSPVMKLKLVDDKKASLDATFTKEAKKVVKKPRVSVPSKSKKSRVSLPLKIKKPKKLIAKKDEKPKVADVQKEKADETGADSKPVKAKATAKSENPKKSANPKKPVASVPKKVVTKKASK